MAADPQNEALTADVAAIGVEMSDDDKATREKVVRQIEFYFADSNLPYDRFMWKLHSANPEHWVPIATVSSFKRMKEYLTARGLPWIANALRAASTQLEVDEKGENVRRKTEVREPKSIDERSIYAKGFPVTEDEDMSLQTRLEEYFQGYSNTNAVRMRRDQNKKFKGSVFVEFTEPSGVDAFLLADPKPTWEGTELLIMTKEEYCDMKIKEKGLTGKAADNRRETMSNRKFNAFNLSAKDRAALHPEEKDATPVEVYLEYLGSKLLIHRDEEGKGYLKEEEIPYLPGASLKFEGAGETWSWDEIKGPAKDLFEGRAPFIRNNRGETHGVVGFHKTLDDDDIDKVRKAVKTLGGQEVTWEKLPEEEEKNFQIERGQTAARNALRSSQEKAHQERGGGGRSGRGGRGGRGRGRGGDRGRGRGRGGVRGGSFRKSDATAESAALDGPEQAGDKRKRTVEPSGAPDTGLRGAGTQAPPVIQSAKKLKAENGAAVLAASS